MQFHGVRGLPCVIWRLWIFTSLRLPLSKYLAILAKCPPNKVPTKFHLLKIFPQNSTNSSGILSCVLCNTKWHHTNTLWKSCLLIWMMRSHAMSNFGSFLLVVYKTMLCVFRPPVTRGVTVTRAIPIASDPPRWHPLHTLGLIVLLLRTPGGACKRSFQLSSCISDVGLCGSSW